MIQLYREKIYNSVTDLSSILNKWRSDKKDIVFTNGCFDILHIGHLSYLEYAKSKGDILIIGLNTDKSIKAIKDDSRPINSEYDRAYILVSLAYIDAVILFDEDTPIKLINNIKPNVLVKGADYIEKQVIGSDFVKSYGGKVVFAPYIENKSTTSVINKIINENK